MAIVTLADRPKSVRNRCVIFGGVLCVVTLLLGFFCRCKGFCHRAESDLFLFSSYTCMPCLLKYVDQCSNVLFLFDFVSMIVFAIYSFISCFFFFFFPLYHIYMYINYILRLDMISYRERNLYKLYSFLFNPKSYHVLYEMLSSVEFSNKYVQTKYKSEPKSSWSRWEKNPKYLNLGTNIYTYLQIICT